MNLITNEFNNDSPLAEGQLEGNQSDFACYYFQRYLGQQKSSPELPLPLADNQQLVKEFCNFPSVRKLMTHLNYQFKNPSLCQMAFSHASFSHEFNPFHSFHLEYNERMEFLGDAILGAIISTQLFQQHPTLKEGELSMLRSSLVSEQGLSLWAQSWELEKCLLLGKGEIKNKGMEKSALLANCLEALLAAIYLDSDFATCAAIISKWSLPFFQKIENGERSLLAGGEDAKSRLQEKTMALYKNLPEYRLLREELTSTPVFEVALFINGREVARCVENSKKKAQKILAQKALIKELYCFKSSQSPKY